MNCLSSIQPRSSNSGIVLLGDLIKLNITRLRTSYDLKQIVNFPTRGQSTLDLIRTHLEPFHHPLFKRSSFGLSDHLSIEVKPKVRSQLPKAYYQVKGYSTKQTPRYESLS